MFANQLAVAVANTMLHEHLEQTIADLREAQSELNSLDVVFLARRGLNELEPAEQTRLLQDSWKRLSRRVKRNDFTR